MFKDKLSLVPHKPGSYQMKDKNGTIIYVGKAKDLHNRVLSYFRGSHTGKTAKMVSEVDDFTYIVTSSEVEAFLLEINLIKKYDPKYNILLRDDKTYPYIEYIKKPYPRLKVSRYTSIRKKDNKKLFGPYPNAYAARRIVNLLNRVYPLKKCEGNPKKVCLYYHIGQCLGYCEKKIDNAILEEMEKEILSFLSGNDKILRDRILKKIDEYSSSLNYEMALNLKKELDYIDIAMEKQKMELHDLVNRDVVGYFLNNGYVSIEIFFIRNGKLVGSNNDIFPVTIDVCDEVESYISKFYENHEIPKEILIDNTLNNELLSEVLNTKFITPLKGIKKNLVNLAINNAKINLDNNEEIINKEINRTSGANEELENLLNMKINRIESFDNSNLFGSYAVSGMVVCKNGLPSKKDYRKYKVSVDVNDDYHTMKEVVYRRYFRALMEKTELPDLILVDGGKQQIHAVNDTLEELNLKSKIKVCGLVKNDKHATSELMDGDTLEIYNLDRTSNLFHYLTRIQDEVHRFTINYHKTIRSKGSIASVLDNIDGIGSVRKKQLIKEFGSVTKMKDASIEELTKFIPEKVAIELKKYLEEFKK